MNNVATVCLHRGELISRDMLDDDLRDPAEADIDVAFSPQPLHTNPTIPHTEFAKRHHEDSCAWLRIYFRERHDGRPMRLAVRSHIRLAKLMRKELRRGWRLV